MTDILIVIEGRYITISLATSHNIFTGSWEKHRGVKPMDRICKSPSKVCPSSNYLDRGRAYSFEWNIFRGEHDEHCFAHLIGVLLPSTGNFNLPVKQIFRGSNKLIVTSDCEAQEPHLPRGTYFTLICSRESNFY